MALYSLSLEAAVGVATVITTATIAATAAWTRMGEQVAASAEMMARMTAPEMPPASGVAALRAPVATVELESVAVARELTAPRGGVALEAMASTTPLVAAAAVDTTAAAAGEPLPRAVVALVVVEEVARPGSVLLVLLPIRALPSVATRAMAR
jgi:hypothetical protein